MLGAALVLLLAVLGFNALDGESSQGSRMVDERAFKIEDADEIGRVFISDRRGYTTDLRRQNDGRWELDGQYNAYDNAMKNLIDALTRIEMQFIPANKAVPNIIKNLATEGIHVEVFDRGGDKMKGYYIGGSTQDERGTYAIMEEAEQPYVVHIPGWTGNIRFRYNLVDQEWRSRELFTTPIEEIQRVSVEYPTRRNRSFVLEREGDQYFVSPYFENQQARRVVPRGRAEGYLVNFEKSYVSIWQNQKLEAKAEAIARLPYAIVRLQRTDGSEKDLKLFPLIPAGYEAYDPNTDAYLSALGERGYEMLIDDNTDFAVAQSGGMSKFLRTYDNF